MTRVGATGVTGAMAVLLMLAAAAAPAQRRPHQVQPYDSVNEMTFSGTVREVALVDDVEGGVTTGGVHLLLETDQEMLEVHVGPAWYLDEQGLTFGVGQAIAVTGSYFTLGAATPNVLARTIVREGETVRLRDGDGVPVWAGRGRGARGR